MAQFTVHRNKNPGSRNAFPLLLDVQTDLLEALKTRVVIPLSRAGALAKKPLEKLTPIVPFEGEAYVLVTPQLAGIPHSELGAAIGSLAGHCETVIAALDFLLTGI